jgi:site-specific recombinase XerD
MTDYIFLNQLYHKFVTEFDHYFRIAKGCNNNTTVKYIKNLKKVVNLAVKNDWLRKDPFDKYSVKIKPVKRDYLSEEELKRIEDLELKMPRLDQIRDLFVFSCYTGYAYVDVSMLTKENIHIGIDGERWIYKDRKKTSTKSNVPLLPKAVEIIEKYRNHPETESSELLLPVISNQKTNAYLKEIASLAGIEKNLTFHVARHTFATLMLTKGITIESVAEMLGHNNIKTTHIYAKITERKVSGEMSKLREEFSKQLSVHKKISK